MNEYKSISELAKEINVSRQAVYQRIRNDKELSTSLQPFTVNESKRTVYTLQGQELIKQAFSAHCKQELDSSLQSIDSKQVDTECKQIDTDCKAVDSGLQSQLEEVRENNRTLSEDNKQLTAENRLLTAQVELLQSQLEELKADKEYLKKLIDDLTAALTAAQALHGIEKQQKVIEVKEAAAPAPDPSRSERRSRSEQRSPAPAPVRSGTQKEQRTKMTFADRLRKIFR